MLEKLTTNTKVASLCLALQPWVDEDRRNINAKLPEVSKRSYPVGRGV